MTPGGINSICMPSSTGISLWVALGCRAPNRVASVQKSNVLDWFAPLYQFLFYMFIWNLGKLTVYYWGLYSIIWASIWGKSLVFIGHFSRFRHNKNITDISGSNWPLLTASPKEKNKQNTLFKHQILRSKFSVCSTFTIFSSYGLIFCILNTGLLNSNSLWGANVMKYSEK